MNVCGFTSLMAVGRYSTTGMRVMYNTRRCGSDGTYKIVI